MKYPLLAAIVAAAAMSALPLSAAPRGPAAAADRQTANASRAEAPVRSRRPPPATRAPLRLRGHVHPADAQAWQLELELSSPASIAVTCDEVGGRRERHRVTRPTALRHDLTVHGLKASTRYRCQAALLDGSGRRSDALELVTAPLPPGLVPPTITVKSSDLAATGYTLYNYAYLLPFFKYRSQYLVIVDAEGNVRWYYADVGGGDIDTSYLGNDEVIFGGWAAEFYTPTIVGLDKQVKLTATEQASSPYELEGQFNHDAGISEDGRSIFTLVISMIDDTWKGFVVKEIDRATNQVAWWWDSQIDGVDEGLLGEGSVDLSDPYHNNSVMERVENGRRYLYVGIRDYHQLLKIDYETKALVWRLGVDGDFTLLEADGRPADPSRWFFNQHDAQVAGDRVTVYDNGSDRPEYGGNPYSRALQLELDEAARTARIVFEYTESGWYEPAWGGHDLLESGNALVALGHCWSCGGTQHPSALIEVAPEGQVVWRGDWSNNRIALYRADRIDGCAIFSNTTYCPGLAE